MTKTVNQFRDGASATVPDPAREIPQRWWDPSRKLIRAIRGYQAARGPFAPVMRRIYVLRYRFWSVVTGADIPLNTRLGLGFMMPHPNGIVIHANAVIGINCMLFQQVTIAGAVTVGNHVDIGAGAKVIGPLRIGDHVQIGANAVVTKDVADDTVMVGIPARPI